MRDVASVLCRAAALQGFGFGPPEGSAAGAGAGDAGAAGAALRWEPRPLMELLATLLQVIVYVCVRMSA